MIVGISGKIGVGKTTVAKELERLLVGYERVAFGDVLKREAADFFGFPVEWCYSAEGKAETVRVHGLVAPKDVMTVRELLQFYGTDVCRKADPDYWVRAMDSFVGDRTDLIVDDVRFPNEHAWVRAKGGVMIRLEPWAGWTPGPHAEHESETALDGCQDFDAVIFQHDMHPHDTALAILMTVLDASVRRYRTTLIETRSKIIGRQA